MKKEEEKRKKSAFKTKFLNVGETLKLTINQGNIACFNQISALVYIKAIFFNVPNPKDNFFLQHHNKTADTEPRQCQDHPTILRSRLIADSILII